MQLTYTETVQGNPEHIFTLQGRAIYVGAVSLVNSLWKLGFCALHMDISLSIKELRKKWAGQCSVSCKGQLLVGGLMCKNDA